MNVKIRDFVNGKGELQEVSREGWMDAILAAHDTIRRNGEKVMVEMAPDPAAVNGDVTIIRRSEVLDPTIDAD